MAFFCVVVILGRRKPRVVDCASKIAEALGADPPIPTPADESNVILAEDDAPSCSVVTFNVPDMHHPLGPSSHKLYSSLFRF